MLLRLFFFSSSFIQPRTVACGTVLTTFRAGWHVFCPKVIMFVFGMFIVRKFSGIMWMFFSSWNTHLPVCSPCRCVLCFPFWSSLFDIHFLVFYCKSDLRLFLSVFLTFSFFLPFFFILFFFSDSGVMKPRYWYQMWWLSLDCHCSFTFWKDSTMKCVCLCMQRYAHVCTHTIL